MIRLTDFGFIAVPPGQVNTKSTATCRTIPAPSGVGQLTVSSTSGLTFRHASCGVPLSAQKNDATATVGVAGISVVGRVMAAADESDQSPQWAVSMGGLTVNHEDRANGEQHLRADV